MSLPTGHATVTTGTLRGVEALPVEVEVVTASGLPSFTIVGLGDTAVHEARDRVRAAIRSCGLRFPDCRVTVNLAPAPLRKHGTGFDLPIALGILSATGQLPGDDCEHAWCVGELSLDGRVRATDGTMAHALSARTSGRTLWCSENARLEVESVPGVQWRSLSSLAPPWPVSCATPSVARHRTAHTESASVIAGHEAAKRSLYIAAAGRLNLLMIGPPGSGKTMLARSLPGLLPPLEPEESIESALIHSVAGLDPTHLLEGRRPFRAPHHSATRAGLIGGGTPVRPGEVSLAHHGVLFLDELTEFGPSVLQALRQPIEDGAVTLVRADGAVRLPARFMLVAAANPCPCGFNGDPERACRCTPHAVDTYSNRIGGPLLDRMDLSIRVDRIDPALLLEMSLDASSAPIDSILIARERARMRTDSCASSGDGVHPIETLRCTPCTIRATEELAREDHLSGRGIARLLRVARTIADLEESDEVTPDHLYEAHMFRVEGMTRP